MQTTFFTFLFQFFTFSIFFTIFRFKDIEFPLFYIQLSPQIKNFFLTPKKKLFLFNRLMKKKWVANNKSCMYLATIRIKSPNQTFHIDSCICTDFHSQCAFCIIFSILSFSIPSFFHFGMYTTHYKNLSDTQTFTRMFRCVCEWVCCKR
jgi:hypothetical protein